MRNLDTVLIENAVYKAALHAGVNLTSSCKSALCSAYESEREGAAKFALGELIKTAKLPKRWVCPSARIREWPSSFWK